MVRFALACVAFLCLPSFVAAQTVQPIHKCVMADGITYQGTPCGSDAVVAQVSARPTESVSALAMPDCGRHSRLPFGHGSLCMGITDDEVLNLPAWGRPSAIVRSRSGRAWQELWTYDGRSGGTRRLQFLNGKLASVETEPAGSGALAMDSGVHVFPR